MARKKKPTLAQRVRKNLLEKIRYYRDAGFDVNVEVPDIPNKTATPQEKGKYTKALKRISKAISDKFSLGKKRTKEERQNILSQRAEKPKVKKKEIIAPDIPEKFKTRFMPDYIEEEENNIDVSAELRREFDHAKTVYESIQRTLSDTPFTGRQSRVQREFEKLLSEYGEDDLLLALDLVPEEIITEFESALMLTHYGADQNSKINHSIRNFFDAITHATGLIMDDEKLAGYSEADLYAEFGDYLP